jgi:hypothetical protein
VMAVLIQAIHNATVNLRSKRLRAILAVIPSP